MLGAVLLAGCSSPAPPVTGSGSPGQSAPATATAAASAAQTNPPTTVPAPAYKPATAAGPAQNVPVPVLPAKAKEFSKEGLEAFATYWYSTLGYVFETGNSKPMMAITDEKCGTCQKTNGPIAEWYKSRGWITGGKMTVHSSTSSFQMTPNGAYQAILLIEQSQVSYFNPDGSLDEALPPTAARQDILVAKYASGRWTANTAEHLTRQ